MTLLESAAAPDTATNGFSAVVGRVTGRAHRRAHRDGQDGFALVNRRDVTAAIVTDGCSSGRTSEVGARLGAAWLAELVTRVFPGSDPATAAGDVTRTLVERLRTTACSLSAGDAIDHGVLGDMLLFGFLAAVVTTEHAIVFGVGDGIAWVDGQTTVIDPGPENAPPYVAYALLGATIAPRILHVSAARDVDIVAVATDGADELVAPTSAPQLDTLVRDDRLFTNPSLLGKRLRVLSDRGCFWDDTTIGVVRRRA